MKLNMKCYMIIVLITIFILIILIVSPCLLIKCNTINNNSGNINGVVYKINTSQFLISLETKTTLILDIKKRELFLLNKKGLPLSLIIGKYLITSRHILKGHCLSNSETFTAQKPVIKDGSIEFKDPMVQRENKVIFSLSCLAD